MVRLKFILRNGVLALRISENKERYYRRVSHLLIGKPNLEKHWNEDKQRFSAYAINQAKNNQILDNFRKIFQDVVDENPFLSAKQVASHYKAETKQKPDLNLSEWATEEYADFISKYLEMVIIREKAKQGCNYEPYHKLLSRCRRVIPNFDVLRFNQIDYNKMVSVAYIFANEKSYRNYTKTFRALLGKASKDKDVHFDISQIGDFKFNDYNPDRCVVNEKHPDILTDEQLRTFLNLNVEYLTPRYRDRKQVALYYDFCVFMFHSFFAPCDVIKAKLRDITRKNTLLVKRKKTHRTVEIPITPVMKQIIDKYKGQSKDGYIFPIMDDELERQYATKDYIFKKFREKLNVWLKSIGRDLDLDYDLYAYVFRHTAITVAINSGLPISYVANAAGTSVEMIQEHYYNGENIQNRDMLTQAFMRAGV